MFICRELNLSSRAVTARMRVLLRVRSQLLPWAVPSFYQNTDDRKDSPYAYTGIMGMTDNRNKTVIILFIHHLFDRRLFMDTTPGDDLAPIFLPIAKSLPGRPGSFGVIMVVALAVRLSLRRWG